MFDPDDKKDPSSNYDSVRNKTPTRSSDSERFPVRYHGRQNVPPAQSHNPCGCQITRLRETSLYCGPHSEPVAAVTLSDGEERLFPYDKFLNCPCYEKLNGKLPLPEKPLYREPISAENHNCRTCVWCRNTRYLTQASRTTEPTNSTSATEVESSTPVKHSRRPTLVIEQFSAAIREKGLESPEAQALLSDLILQAENRRAQDDSMTSENAEFMQGLSNVTITQTAQDPLAEPIDNYPPPNKPVPPDITPCKTTSQDLVVPGTPAENYEHAHFLPDKPVPPDIPLVKHSPPPLPVAPTHHPGNKRPQSYRAKQTKPKRKLRRGVVLSGEGVALS